MKILEEMAIPRSHGKIEKLEIAAWEAAGNLYAVSKLTPPLLCLDPDGCQSVLLE